MRNWYKIIWLILFGATLFAFAACGKDDPEKIAQKDREKILEYLAENDLEAIEHESGIFYIIENEGSGGSPKVSSWVSVSYTGTLLNGKVFDTRTEYTTYLYSLVLGWQIGLPLFKKGGKGMLFIPSGMAYGEYARMGIPANSVLIFEIELIDFR